MAKQTSSAQRFVTVQHLEAITVQALKGLSANPIAVLWEDSAKAHLLDAALDCGFGLAMQAPGNSKTQWVTSRPQPGGGCQRLSCQGISMPNHCDLALVQLLTPTCVNDIQVKVFPAHTRKSLTTARQTAKVAEDLSFIVNSTKSTGKKGRPRGTPQAPLVVGVVVVVQDDPGNPKKPDKWLDGSQTTKWKGRNVPVPAIAPSLTSLSNTSFKPYGQCCSQIEWTGWQSFTLARGQHYLNNKGAAVSFGNKNTTMRSVQCAVFRARSALRYPGSTQVLGHDLHVYVYMR